MEKETYFYLSILVFELPFEAKADNGAARTHLRSTADAAASKADFFCSFMRNKGMEGRKKDGRRRRWKQQKIKP
jgi:hypothetical protein